MIIVEMLMFCKFSSIACSQSLSTPRCFLKLI